MLSDNVVQEEQIQEARPEQEDEAEEPVAEEPESVEEEIASIPEPEEDTAGMTASEPENDETEGAEPEEPEPEEPESEKTEIAGRVIDPEKPMIALTFDDGPYRNNTKALLDLFEQYNGRATFFVVGYHLDVYTEDTLDAYRRGFQIGNHTLNHPALRQISDEEGMKEIEGMNQKLNELGIPGEAMLRPPYGEYTEYLQENLNVPMIGWNVDSADWLTKDAENIYVRVVGNVKDGDIVLLHDLQDATAEAMKRVVPALVEQGFQLVTVEELFRAKGIEPQAGQYYYYIR